jgi:hypothetical protein
MIVADLGGAPLGVAAGTLILFLICTLVPGLVSCGWNPSILYIAY